MASPVKITDGERTVSIDKVTHALNVVDYEHHEIHAGSAYRVGSSADALADADTLSIDFKTPASGKQIHMVLNASTENAANVVFYEGVEVSSNGTALTPRNANRNVADESSMQFIFKDSTLVTTNTVTLGNRQIGSVGIKPSDPSLGGDVSSRHEWILREDSWYSIIITNISGVAQNVWAGLDWYEHTPKG